MALMEAVGQPLVAAVAVERKPEAEVAVAHLTEEAAEAAHIK